jgi:hypothetical protein
LYGFLFKSIIIISSWSETGKNASIFNFEDTFWLQIESRWCSEGLKVEKILYKINGKHKIILVNVNIYVTPLFDKVDFVFFYKHNSKKNIRKNFTK